MLREVVLFLVHFSLYPVVLLEVVILEVLLVAGAEWLAAVVALGIIQWLEEVLAAVLYLASVEDLATVVPLLQMVLMRQDMVLVVAVVLGTAVADLVQMA